MKGSEIKKGTLLYSQQNFKYCHFHSVISLQQPIFTVPWVCLGIYLIQRQISCAVYNRSASMTPINGNGEKTPKLHSQFPHFFLCLLLLFLYYQILCCFSFCFFFPSLREKCSLLWISLQFWLFSFLSYGIKYEIIARWTSGAHLIRRGFDWFRRYLNDTRKTLKQL